MTVDERRVRGTTNLGLGIYLIFPGSVLISIGWASWLRASCFASGLSRSCGTSSPS